MKANELRIGNYATINNEVWADFRNKPMIITGIDTELDAYKKELFPNSTGIVKLKYGDLDFGQYDEYIKPIPLTDEWLSTTKLVSNDRGDWKYYDENSEVEFVISYNKYDNAYFYTGGEGVQLSRKITYVHQLQNIYFALTGQEL